MLVLLDAILLRNFFAVSAILTHIAGNGELKWRPRYLQMQDYVAK